MASLFDTEVVLNHRAFQQPFQGGTGLPGPAGVAFATLLHTEESASTDDWNFGNVKPLGVPGYVYTVADVFARCFFRSSAASSADAVKAKAFAESFACRYEHYPLYSDIGDQAFHDADGLIPSQEWAFEVTQAWNGFYEDATNGAMPIGSYAIAQPARSPNHPGNYPTSIPTDYDADKSPKITMYCGEITTSIRATFVDFKIGVAYHYWNPRDRLTADAYSELPVRGT